MFRLAAGRRAVRVACRPAHAGQVRHRVAVILTEPLEHLGFHGQEVTVKAGFARNYLIPQRKAVYATADNVKVYKLDEPPVPVTTTADGQAKPSEVPVWRARLAAKNLTFTRAVSDGSNLYGSVTVADVVKQLGEEGVAVDAADVRLVEGEGVVVDRFKTAGEFSAEVAVTGVWLPVRVTVVGDSEA